MRSALRLVALLCAVCLLTDFASAYYNPSTGRWLSRDPAGEGITSVPQPATNSERFLPRDLAGTNIYAFVDNAPTGSIDSLGLWKFVPDIMVFDGQFGPTTVTSVGSSFFLAAIPNVEQFTCLQCSEIRFIQIYRAFNDVTFPVVTGRGVNWSYRWTLDADVPPYYPYNPPWHDPRTNGVSSMNDTPQLPLNGLQRSGGYVVQMEFETCALCSKGGAIGEVYGCVKWRHRLTYKGDRRRFIARGTDVDWASNASVRMSTDSTYQYRYRPWDSRRSTDIPTLTTVGPTAPIFNFRNQEGLNPSAAMASFLSTYFP